MCRLLCVRSLEVDIDTHLAAFADLAKNSREYQGHGWGCAWLDDGGWRIYRNVSPIWEDESRPTGRTTLLLAHARSAFRDEGIQVENNMPFFDGERVFIFNGELQGVRIKEQGRIGAEKIFNYVKRFDRGDLHLALERAVKIIERRTRYVRAMNLIIADAEHVHVASRFDENPDYFQMHTLTNEDTRIVCSETYSTPGGSDGPAGWTAIDNGSIARY